MAPRVGCGSRGRAAIMWKRLLNWVYPERRPLKRCSFCRRTPIKAGPLVEGPLHVFICLPCAELSRKLLLPSNAPGGSIAPPEQVESP